MIPLSRVKSLCTAAELKLVKASRKPELEKLSAERISQLSSQARKSFDKWQDLSRSQARDRSRKTGAGSEYERTQEKVTIFREALDQFREQFDKLKTNPAEAKSGKKPARANVPKAKRTAGARATRAEVRAKLADHKTDLNVTKKAARLAKPASAKPVAGKPKTAAAKKITQVEVSAPVADTNVTAPAEKPKTTRKSSMPAAAKAGKPKPSTLIGAVAAQPHLVRGRGKNIKANTAAKQRGIAKSGQTRVQAHIMARGKRNQARRDSR
jgi:hypothetical protein